MALRGCIATGSINTTMSDSTPVVMEFNAESYDSDNFHSITADKDKFYAPVAGFYHFLLYINVANAHGKTWSAYITGSKDTNPYRNGPATYFASNSGTVAEGLIHTECMDWYGWMQAGEYLACTLTQHSSVPSSVSASVTFRASITMIGANLAGDTCKIGRYSQQSLSLPENEEITIPWTREYIDTNDMWSSGTPNDVTIKTSGMYQILLLTKDSVNPDTASLGVHIRIKKNGTEIYFGRTSSWRQPTWHSIITSLQVNDIITVTMNNVRTNSSHRTLDAYQSLPNLVVMQIDK